MWPRLAFGALTAALGGIAGLILPQLLRVLVDDLAAHPTKATLMAGIGVMAIFGVLEAAMYAARRQFTVKPAVAIERQMREDLFVRLQRLPAGFHDAWSSGQLLSRSMSDLGLVRRYLAFGSVMTVSSAVVIAVGLVMMYILDWRFFLLYAVIVAPMFIAGTVFRTRFHQASRRVMDLQGELATTVEESVQGIRILKAFGRADFSARQLVARLSGLKQAELGKASTLGWFIGVVTALPGLTMAAALLIGVRLVVEGQMSPGTLVAFFATAGLLSNPLAELGQFIGMYVATKAALERHVEIMREPTSIASPSQPESPARSGRLELRGVGFRYPDAAPDAAPILHDVNLRLTPGETMALVGETGSGKSTLLQLIPRIYEATEGTVLVDGADVRSLALADLRTRIAVAFEDATLFSDSVRRNVLLGVPAAADDDEREAALAEALRVAQAGFVASLPEGADTQIGEEGLSLSGGQRQRLALARAVAARPDIMLLDDPLSALDVSTEERVIAELGDALAETTTLIVAHRPSTVALADRVALLEGGTITAVGPHQQLLEENAHYRHVISSLHEDETVEELFAPEDEPVPAAPASADETPKGGAA
ncbi:ABC transporter ATP-binding protein [Falsarthrobacter nasiphocae]|uniref:ATP-binding cassette subfamily B protein n=1 Tax=Falsarthrobacter nasiphocae TaxID=189863 RepID=A0AAE3YED9_9MICC|nr:ABC transporter ATP-binding protein [Falsarthrobacter nasiphocae]MDR6892338.1 ATP-binding cassette subfamily B protein [Falsarthrobacter nasiphocae]